MLFSVGAAVSDEINCFPVGIAPVNHGIDLVHAFVDQGPGGAPAAAVVCAEKRCVLFFGPCGARLHACDASQTHGRGDDDQQVVE